MPAVEISLAAKPASSGDSGAGVSSARSKAIPNRQPGGTDGMPAPFDDFDSLMQAKLAPPSAKTPGKHFQQEDKNPVATKQAASANSPAIGTKETADKNPTKTGGDEKKSADGTDGTIAAGQTFSPPPTATVEPLPAFFSLPLFFGSASPVPPTVNVSASENTAVTTDALAGVQASACSGGSVLAAPGTLKPELRPQPAGAALVSLAAEKIISPGSVASGAKPEKAAAETASPVGLLKTVSADVTATSLSQEKAQLQETVASANPKSVAEKESISAKDTVFPKDVVSLNDAQPTLVSSAQTLAVRLETEQAAPAQHQPEIHPKEDRPENSAVHESPMINATTAGGTGVAISAVLMKNPMKTTKVAEPDVKVLPVAANGEAREKNLPTPLLATPVRAANNHGADLNFSFSNGNNPAPATASAPALPALDLPSLADARLRAVERTHDMMALHAMRLVESKSDTLSVVIKPAVGTELSLELRQRNGGVEAQATLTRGDHQFLNQHWPELQQRLEQRGIKLAPLGGEAGFSAGDNGNFQRQQTSQEDVAQQASAFAEFASIATVGGATARLAAARDGWESWA